MDTGNMNFSVVSTVYNNSEEITEYLENITRQTIAPSEIVIADGGSTDDTRKKVELFADKCSIPINLISDGRLNISQGINRAIEESKHEYIIVTAVGNEYADDFFSALLDTLQNQNADVVYCPICGKDTTDFSRIYNEFYGFCGDGCKGATASNHGVLIKRSVIIEVGFFYEKFIYAGEDTEFFTRVKNRNYICICTDATKLFWITPASLKEYCRQMEVYLIADMQMYSARHVIRNQYKAIALVLCCLLVLLLLCVNKTRLIGAVLCTFALLLGSIKVKKRNLSTLRFILISYLFPLYYLIKNAKYMLPKYHIDENDRRK